MKMLMLTTLAVALEVAGVSSTLAAPTIFVDQTATYSYINATSATELGSPASNWFASGFDDSAWFTGNGVFSSTTPSSTIFDQSNASGPFGGTAQSIPTTFTNWDINFAPFLRTHFDLTAPTALSVWIAVDNGIGTTATDSRNGTGAQTGMYINGVTSTNVGLVNAEGNAFRWENVFNVPADLTVAGDNVFALQLEDHGGLTGFDMMITSEVGDNPIFTTLPPLTPPPSTGVPEPQALWLLGVGVVAIALLRRRYQKSDEMQARI